VATSTIEKLLDYVMHTAPDEHSSAASVNTITQIIDHNMKHAAAQNGKPLFSYESL
jgi:4-O-beta-D-mannosyl-D-glucose phosphorylase